MCSKHPYIYTYMYIQIGKISWAFALIFMLNIERKNNILNNNNDDNSSHVAT